ncbi:MAG: LysM peptidoglycan-binding domain-containing protein [Anaerolineae bacterium]|jgi:LysM repeat protein|nr:LysM peptidoglycan-binding domain-containing protein [Anaerolineae bacterium]
MFRRILLFVVIAGVIVSLLGLGARAIPVQAQTGGGNLLVNGDFESGAGEAWPFQDGIPEVQIAPGWRAYYVDQRPAYARIPDYCAPDDQHCAWGRPEFRGTSTAEFAYRIHGGFLSQKYFSWNRQHEAGLYQQVSNIAPGTILRFQVYMQTWSCLPGEQWNDCPTGHLSNQPAPMHTKVGIDPTGGTNPWSPTVIWSPEKDAYDVYTLFTVEATAQAGTVTVFTYSRADWPEPWPRISNDVYIDDASLVAIGQGDLQPTAAPPPTPGLPQPTSAVPEVPAAPAATSTPRPDGAVIHVVQPGDTLLGIAIQYGVELEELQRLNAGTLGPSNLIIVGQELVISGTAITLPTPTPQATAFITTPMLTPDTTTPIAIAPTPQTDKAALCVLAYNDANADLTRQTSTEGLVPGTVVSLVGMNGPAGSYTTDGMSEPYCFQNLEPGNYVLRQTPATGYSATGPAEWGVLLGAGQTYALELGYAWGASPAPAVEQNNPEATEAVPTSENDTGKTASTLMKIVQISGIIVAVLAVGVGVLFFLSRRKV